MARPIRIQKTITILVLFVCYISECQDLPGICFNNSINSINKSFHVFLSLNLMYDQTTPSSQYYPQKNESKSK